MKQQVTRDLHSHWEQLRGDRAAPDRAEIDPIVIRDLLNDTFMLSNDAKADFPIRLAGARIGELFLSELKGLPLPGLFCAEDRDSIRALLVSVIDDPTPVVAGVNAAPFGRPALDLELLLLPLAPLHGLQGRILGSLTPCFRVSWSGLLACEPLRLTSLRIVRPANARPVGRIALDPAMWASLPLRDVQIGEKSPSRRPHLTLYNG